MNKRQAEQLIAVLQGEGYHAHLYDYTGNDIRVNLDGVITNTTPEQLEAKLKQMNMNLNYACDTIGKDYIYY